MADLTERDLVRAVETALRIEADFIIDPPGPVKMILYRAKLDAASALAGLVSVDPHDVKTITQLQNEVHRYRDILRFVEAALAEGHDAADKLDEEDVEDLAKAIGLTETPDA